MNTAADSHVRTMWPAPMIEGQQIFKSYTAGKRQVEILHGVSLSITAGEMCAVMGPSGSGKSTLMYVLARLEDPTQGSVTLLGQDLAQVSRAGRAKMRRTEIGFVFQQYNLVPTLTAFENVALPYRLRGASVPKDLIMAKLEALNLGRLSASRPPQMSGGEQQRVALARVLAQQPQIVFADEPTGALDTNTGVVVLDELVSIAHQPEQCVLTVTHDPAVAAKCDRVLFMLDGNLVAELASPNAADVSNMMRDLAGRAVA